MSGSPADAIQSLSRWLQESRYTTAFSGAGASTEVDAIDDISLLASGR